MTTVRTYDKCLRVVGNAILVIKDHVQVNEQNKLNDVKLKAEGVR